MSSGKKRRFGPSQQAIELAKTSSEIAQAAFKDAEECCKPAGRSPDRKAQAWEKYLERHRESSYRIQEAEKMLEHYRAAMDVRESEAKAAFDETQERVASGQLARRGRIALWKQYLQKFRKTGYRVSDVEQSIQGELEQSRVERDARDAPETGESNLSRGFDAENRNDRKAPVRDSKDRFNSGPKPSPRERYTGEQRGGTKPLRRSPDGGIHGDKSREPRPYDSEAPRTVEKVDTGSAEQRRSASFRAKVKASQSETSEFRDVRDDRRSGPRTPGSYERRAPERGTRERPSFPDRPRPTRAGRFSDNAPSGVDRKSGFGGPPKFRDRPDRGGERPAYKGTGAPRKFSERPSRDGERPAYRGTGGPRKFGDKPDRGGERPAFRGTGGPRKFGDRPPRDGERPAYSGTGGPRKFGDKPDRGGDRPAYRGTGGPRKFADRPPRDGERPSYRSTGGPRKFGDKPDRGEDRPAYRGPGGPRKFGDRPARDGEKPAYRGTGGPRKFGDRPAGGGDRPRSGRASFGKFGDRSERGGQRPSRTSGAPRKFGDGHSSAENRPWKKKHFEANSDRDGNPGDRSTDQRTTSRPRSAFGGTGLRGKSPFKPGFSSTGTRKPFSRGAAKGPGNFSKNSRPQKPKDKKG